MIWVMGGPGVGGYVWEISDRRCRMGDRRVEFDMKLVEFKKTNRRVC